MIHGNSNNKTIPTGRALSAQTWASGMPSDFGSSGTDSSIYSIYADYIPIKVLGDTGVFDISDANSQRMAMPYTMTEDGFINSISIYHNGGSDDMLLGVYSDYEGGPNDLLAVTAQTAVQSNAGWQEMTSKS